MGTVRFVLRVDKPIKNGTAPIDLIFQVSGQRKYYRTDLKLFPESWNANNQQAVYLDKKQAKKLLPDVDYDLLPSFNDIQECNKTLTDLSSLITTIEKRYQLDKIAYSSEMVIDKLKEETKVKTKIEGRSAVLFEFMDRYIKDHKTTREPGSLSVYRSVKKHLENFCRDTGKKVTFDNIDYAFFQSFQNYLLQDKAGPKGEIIKGLNNTTVARQLTTVKTFLNYARKQGIEVSDKYKDFQVKRESREVIALTNEEFEALYYLDLSNNKKLSQTRDVFCFACCSGLRYSDLQQLKREHIKNDTIKLTVKKTKEVLTIPLNPYSRAILAKYEGLLKPLPVISNQKLNDYVKDLCQLAEIVEPIEIVRYRGINREAVTYPKYKLIGVHTGRRTFATLSLEKGMNAEEVMSITGHRDYKSFKRYVKVTEQRKKVVMSKAWGGATESKLKAV